MTKQQRLILVLCGIGIILNAYLKFAKPEQPWLYIFTYVIMGLAVIIFFYLLIKPHYCGNCGTKLPRLRKPQTGDQAMFGGWTCPNCGASLDSSGRVKKRRSKKLNRLYV